MGRCDVAYRNCQRCANCPCKSKFGCCRLLDGTDSCARTTYFLTLAIAALLPQYAQRIGKISQKIATLRDLIEIANCFKDYIDLFTGELFESSCPIERKSSAISLAASIATPLPILAERGLLPLRFKFVAPFAKFLSALGHGFALFGAFTKEENLQGTDSSCECAYQLSELFEPYSPEPLTIGIGILTGSWKGTRTLVA